MKKIIKSVCIALIVFAASFIIYSNTNLTTFIYNGLEFYKIGIVKEPIEETKLIYYININDYILKHSYQYNLNVYVNEQLKHSYNYFIKFDKFDFNGIKCLAIFSYDKNQENNNICLDLYNIKDLYWLYHNVLIYNKEKKLIFFQLFEYDYQKKMRRRIDKDLEKPDSSFNNDKIETFSELGLKFGKMTLFIDEVFLLNFFDYKRFIEDNGNISIKIPKTHKYQKAKIQKIDKVFINMMGKQYPAIYCKLIPDLSFLELPFVNLDKNCLELYFIDGDIPIIGKYVYKYQINEDDFVEIQELINFD